VVIENKGYISAKPESGAATNLISIVSLSGDTKGRTWYDLELGAVVESNDDQSMRMKMKAMGQEISSQMAQAVTNLLKEVKAAQ
jgi:CheY-specific phosphatase CheX